MTFDPFPARAKWSTGGEGGIRTRGDLRHTAFRERHHQPLGHLSTSIIAVLSRLILAALRAYGTVPRGQVVTSACRGAVFRSHQDYR